MKKYELMLVLDTKLNPDDVSSYLEKLNELVTNLGGSVTETNKWGKRKLAYPINKHTEGVYLVINLMISQSLVIELRKFLKSSEEVIRFLLIKV